MENKIFTPDMASIRLYHAVCNGIPGGPPRETITIQQVLKEVTVDDLRRTPNCGRKSIKEFIAFKEKFAASVSETRNGENDGSV